MRNNISLIRGESERETDTDILQTCKWPVPKLRTFFFNGTEAALTRPPRRELSRGVRGHAPPENFEK